MSIPSRKATGGDDAAAVALSRLGGELADRGCQSELLAGGTAPWLLVSNPAVEHLGAAVVAWSGSFWWTWGDCLGALGDVTRAADRVATSLTAPPRHGEAGNQA